MDESGACAHALARSFYTDELQMPCAELDPGPEDVLYENIIIMQKLWYAS